MFKIQGTLLKSSISHKVTYLNRAQKCSQIGIIRRMQVWHKFEPFKSTVVRCISHSDPVH